MAFNTNVKEYLSGKHNWYTPAVYADAARTVMGGIDLDPASDSPANDLIKARKYYSLLDRTDGLTEEWSGRVFLNPPYGRRYGTRGPFNLGLWIPKLIKEFKSGRVTEAVLLTNAATGADWFLDLWDRPICFVDHRIQFIDGDTMQPQPDPRHFNAFTYFGKKTARFAAVFSQFGTVATRYVAPPKLYVSRGNAASLEIPS